MQVQPRKLVVRHRPKPNSSLFVRLHPATALALWKDALDAASDSTVFSGDGWNVTEEKASSAQVTSGIEFMPLSIQGESDDNRIVFASYNGGDILDETVVELPACFLPKEKKVFVSVIPHVLVAKEVTVETLSAQDWERLSQLSDWLEEGGFLDQVSLVYANQQIEIALPDGSVAHVRILNVEEDSPRGQASSLWPNEASFETMSDSIPPCRRIVADTELVLLPSALDDQSISPTFQLQAAKEDYSFSMQRLHRALEATSPLVSCARDSVVMNPSDWTESHRFVRLSTVGEASNGFLDKILLQVEFSASVKPKYLALHPLTRLSMGLSLDNGKVSLEKVLPIEWEQATKNGAPLNQEIVFHKVKPVRSNGSFRYPSILSSGVLPLDEMSDDASEPACVPIRSLVAAKGSTGTDRTMFKVFKKSAGSVPSVSGLDDEDICVPLDELHCLLKQKADTVAKIEEIIIREFINFLPPRPVPAKKIIGLGPKLLQNESFILVGKSGSGKTHTALTVAAMSHFMTGRQVEYLDCAGIRNLRRMTDILDALGDVIREAVTKKALLVLDDLDELVIQDHFESSQGSGAQVQQPNWPEMEQSKLIRDHIQQALFKDEGGVRIVITCETPDAVSSILPVSSKHTVLQLPLFDSSERVNFLLSHLRLPHEVSQGGFEETFRHALASLDFEGSTRSFLSIDFCALASRVRKSMDSVRWDVSKISDCIRSELDLFIPVSRDAASLESGATSKKANWDDVGGLFQAKQSLLDAVFRPSRYRRIYEKSRVRLPRGILLFGPSGCGKSFAVPALASYCRLPLIMCRGPELLDRYIGGSEAKVRELFSRAFLAAPCILFLDEFDALAPKRGTDSNGVTDRVVNQLLTFLDGVEDFASGGAVYIIAATSRPDKIDPALLRPGRLEKHIFIGIPECKDEMIDVITKIARKYNLTHGALDSFCSGFEWNGRGLSPADVRAAFQTAHLLALRRCLEDNTKKLSNEIFINDFFLREGFSKVRPSLSEEDATCYEKLRERFQKRKTLNDSNRSSDQVPKTPLRTALR